MRQLCDTAGLSFVANFCCRHWIAGSGKTSLACSLIRDGDVRKHYQRVLWVNIGSESGLLELQGQLYRQLLDAALNESQQDTAENLRLMQKAAKAETTVLVLDDLWKEEHEQALNCVSASNGSKVLVVVSLGRRCAHIARR